MLKASHPTTEVCENSYGAKGIKWLATEGNEFCFDGETPVYVQLGAQGKTVRYEPKSLVMGEPDEKHFELPEYCNCPKQNPFKLLDDYAGSRH